MKRLFLLRHAKTVQDTGEGDHARILTERGRDDAALIGHYMDMRGYLPDAVLCSTSARTRETWDILSGELARVPEPAFTRALYLASAKKMLSLVQDVPDEVGSLLVIAHNPGTEELAAKLARKPKSEAETEKLAKLKNKYSTGGLTVFDFDQKAWKDVTLGEGILLEFVRPKDLYD
ncbi:MAG TPA: histidine phosphatase family protein [Rhizomicrobium sp.]|nr:histidine phosphatase family protein [Rhizomicrobium sp.]